jgi:hypothetical protein
MPAGFMQNASAAGYSNYGNTKIGFAGDITGAPNEYQSLNYRPPVGGGMSQSHMGGMNGMNGMNSGYNNGMQNSQMMGGSGMG